MNVLQDQCVTGPLRGPVFLVTDDRLSASPTDVGRQNKKGRKMSAGHLCRQTKQEKAGKCLPVTTYGGRQNKKKQENVCQPTKKSADKTRESRKISASPPKSRQTKQEKTGKCLPAHQKVGRQNKIKQENVRKPTKKPADKTRENRKMSAAKANKAENS